jgi:ribosomal RNA small subunit methyltransferase B
LSEGKEKPFTVVNEAVAAAKHSRKMMKAANFVNAILRRFGREKTELLAKAEKQPTVRFNAPDWWIRRYEAVFGEQAPEIFALQQKHPPMTLRVNTRKVSVEEAKAKLEKARIPTERVGKFGLILLSPKPVKDVPGFTEGEVSVQDAGSQLAAELLDAKKGMRVLDACAAPGGKTAHILELAEVDMTALEIDPKRASRITENLDRLGLKAKVAVADAGEPKKWWDGRPFERILLDAPCTASGIVRRHPDIPWSRKPEDIGKLARTQGKLLETMWPLLANNGRILYAVCSVFPEEGPRGIEGFCARHPDAKLIPIGPKGEKLLSLAPAESLQDSDSVWPATHDGFFYALLEKI